jgi:hypothetical protein
LAREQGLHLADPSGFTRGFAQIVAQGWQAAAAASSPLFAPSARVIGELTQASIAALFDTPAFVQAGALMSYGPDLKSRSAVRPT